MARVPDAEIAERAERVWDLLAHHPEGLKTSEICGELEIGRPALGTARKWLQRYLSDERTQVLNYNPSTQRWSLAVERQPTRVTARWLMRHLRTRSVSLELFSRIAHDQFGEAIFPELLVTQVERTKEDLEYAIKLLERASEDEQEEG